MGNVCIKTYGFDEQLCAEKQNRKALEVLYRHIDSSGWIEEKDIATQKLGIDGYVLRKGKLLSFEEKIHSKDWRFSTELLLELAHDYGTHHTIGWSVKPIAALCFVDFCKATNEFFVYKTEAMFKEIQKMHADNTFPSGSYYPRPAQNKNMRTINIKVPREAFKQHCILSGKIVSDSVVVQ